MQDIQRVLKAASWRLFIVDSFRTGVVTTTIVLVGLFCLRVAEKLLPVTVDWVLVFLLGSVAAVLGAFFWALARRRRGVALAREVDERAGLRETLSTALCVAGQADGWSRAVIETAQARARRVVVRDAIPIEAPRLWQAPLALVLALLCVWWLPRYDLTGLIAQKEKEEEQVRQVQQVMSEIKVDEQKLEELLKKAGVEQGLGDESDEADPEELTPQHVEDIRREALRKLTKVNELIESKQQSEQARQLEALQNQLRNLKTPGDGPLSEFARSLARGNFAEAKDSLEKLAEQIAEGSMSESDRERAQEQLENLKEQLEQLAENRNQLEEALKEAGLSREQAAQLAQALSDPEAMQQALDKMEGLSEEQKQQLQQMARAQSQAAESCNGMAGALGQMAKGMSSEGMGQQATEGANGLSDQLGQFEAIQQELNNLQAAASECRGQINKLGQSMCEGGTPGQCFGQGAGTQGPWAKGSNPNPGNGMGGPGQGSGGAMDSEQTDFALEKIKQQVVNQGGPIISETIVYGAQVRGQSRAEFESAVRSGKAEAANALEQKAVPKKYQDAVRAYFGRLEQIRKAQESDRSSPKDESD